ncbi:MAG: hypothetical protein RDU76_09630 [Candidatus Edwardsbacteria bacterium]|nr:hypothetical protein [Candidatus Edwardsbacteria bacterium]
MKTRTILGTIAALLVLGQTGYAAANDGILKYFNNTACNVKATGDPVQKREILNNSLQNMTMVLDRVQSLPLVSKDDRAGINQLKTTLQEKQNELAGTNGYDRVGDAQLDDFSDYVVQDMEQAPETITISVVTLLLIVLILVLLF